MEGALDEDTQAALDGFVGKYSFSEKELKTFKELVDNMRGTAWGLLAATGITALLSIIQQVPHEARPQVECALYNISA